MILNNTLDLRNNAIKYNDEEFLSLPVATRQTIIKTIFCEHKHLSDYIHDVLKKIGVINQKNMYFKITKFQTVDYLLIEVYVNDLPEYRFARPADRVLNEYISCNILPNMLEHE